MSKDLDIYKTAGVESLLKDKPEHDQMLRLIRENMPELQATSDLFYKTHSQFEDNMLNVFHFTPIRTVRGVLAQMERSKEAIRELHIKTMRNEALLALKLREFENEKDGLKRDLLGVDILEIRVGMETSKGYLSGAIRRLANFTDQYKVLVATHGIDKFTEGDFEKDEERHHIMTAFHQAICAARAHGGHVDEGNMIYFTQLGINGAHAQFEISRYLKSERALLDAGKAPTHESLLHFLDGMATHFAGSAERYASIKGLAGTHTTTALLTGRT